MPFFVTARTLHLLQWNDILLQLQGQALTPWAFSRCAQAMQADPSCGELGLFEPEMSEVKKRLAETGEALALLDRGSVPPMGGLAALDEALTRLEKRAALSGEALREIALVLRALRETRDLFEGCGEATPLLAERALGFEDHYALEARIADAIDENGELHDRASPELAEARSEVHRLSTSMRNRIEASLQDPEIAEALSDSFYTTRNERLVLPVRANFQGRVRGIVHAASASGATVFIEPEAVLDLSNKHKSALLTIERETLRILREISGQAADHLHYLRREIGLLAEIDLAFARARLALQQEAVPPEVGDEGILALPQMRHPLIPRDEVVANSIHLDGEKRVLILSGPNAGGKTVAIKAAALALLYLRAGLYVPTDAGARIDQFDTLLADIGDEQSLDAHLSTFSAHLENLHAILEHAAPRALVILDEICVGTDPGEGASLAQATLESLADAGAAVLVTTHYRLLKELADIDPRFANACVELDADTLAPTYRLRMGAAGASSALELAQRVGLPEPLRQRARDLLHETDNRIEQLLLELSTRRAGLEKEQREQARLRREAEALRSEYEQKRNTLVKRREKLFQKMKSELEARFKKSHEEVAAVIRKLQRGGDAKAATQARSELEEISRAAPQVPVVEEPAAIPVDWENICVGDAVCLPGGERAELCSMPDRRGRVTVRAGTARVVMEAAKLQGAQGTTAAKPKPPRAASTHDSDTRTQEIDLRGMRVEEAVDAVSKALDEAMSTGCARLRIIHGLGTGALRTATRKYLHSSPYVDRYEPAPSSEGGTGATIVRLKS